MSVPRPWQIDMPALVRAAEAWLAEEGIERHEELSAVEQVELWVDGGLLPQEEWTRRGFEALGMGEWDGVGPPPRWTGIAPWKRPPQKTRKYGT